MREEILAEAARALEFTPYRERGEIARHFAERLGISVPTLYRWLKKEGLYKTGRKRREDAGRIRLDGITEDDIKRVAALMFTSHRMTGRIVMPADVAIEIAEANGLIPRGVLKPSTLNRHLRRMQADKRALLAQEPHVNLKSSHPNHTHQLDYSVGIQWYLDRKGLGERDMVRGAYKNKPDQLADAVERGKPKLIRAVLTDHFSGTIYLRYYYEPGESARMAIDFLAHAWRRKDNGNPFHGVPKILMVDKAGAHRDQGFLEFCDALGVRIEDHRAGKANANGQVEATQRIIETRIESKLRVSPARTIEELNELAELECIKLNSERILERTGMTRFGLWQTIRKEDLREIRATHRQLLDLANRKSRKTPVRGDYSIRFEGKQYRLYDVVPGVHTRMKVEVRRNVFADDVVQVRVSPDEPWIEVRAVERLPGIQGGFAADAIPIGEEWAQAPHTDAMRHAREFTRMAYGADSDREAENARKRRDKPFAGVDAFKAAKEYTPPAYMNRPGTELPIAAAPAEAAPIPITKALIRIAQRLGRPLATEENQKIRTEYANGMTEAEIEAWVNRRVTKDRLRAV